MQCRQSLCSGTLCVLTHPYIPRPSIHPSLYTLCGINNYSCTLHTVHKYIVVKPFPVQSTIHPRTSNCNSCAHSCLPGPVSPIAVDPVLRAAPHPPFLSRVHPPLITHPCLTSAVSSIHVQLYNILYHVLYVCSITFPVYTVICLSCALSQIPFNPDPPGV